MTTASPSLSRWRPWSVWGLGALSFVYAFFQRVAPSVMIDPLQREFGLDAGAVGNLVAFYFYSYAAMQVPIGLIVDRFGPRRLLTFGIAICALATAGFALSHDVLLATLCRFLVGFGAGFGFVSTVTLAARWFPPSRFAQFVGMTMGSGTVGGLLAQGPLGWAVELVGWRTALLGSAAAGLALSAALWLIVRDWPPGPREHQRHESLRGLLGSLGRVLSRGQNLLICCVSGAMTAPLLAFGGLWGVAWLMQTKGYTRPEAGATASLLLLGWVFGSPLAGWVSDRLKRRKPVLQAGCVISLATLAPLIYVEDLPAPLLWACLLVTGAASGAVSCSFALARSLNPVVDTGGVLGLVNCSVVASGALFQPLIGLLLDWRWEGQEANGVRFYSLAAFQFALSSLVVVLALALAISLLVREGKAGHSPPP